MTLTRVLATLAGALVLAGVAVTAAAPASIADPAAAKRCANGVADRMGGRAVCIHVGGKCLASHNAKYRARGYTCVNGRLRRVRKPAITVGDASVAEGNAGATTVAVPVTLSAASTSAVTVAYATADGTATAGSDYTAANGTLTFAAGEKQKTIPISVTGDRQIEADETFAVNLSSPANATIAKGTGTVTITNDDTAVAVTPGSYKGSTQNRNYVFFTVTGDRAITDFRANDLSETCDPGGLRLTGGSDFGTSLFPIDDGGGFSAEGTWSGSEQQGDTEWTYWYAKVIGSFDNAASVSGTINEKYELNYKGQHFKCTSGEIRWSATRQG
jgi:Calx-beta domain